MGRREANMKLISKPAPPRGGPFYIVPYRYLEARHEWQKYLPQ